MWIERHRFTPEGSKWWFGPHPGVDSHSNFVDFFCYGEEVIVSNPHNEDYIVCRRHPLLRCEFCGKTSKVCKDKAFMELPNGGISCSQRHSL